MNVVTLYLISSFLVLTSLLACNDASQIEQQTSQAASLELANGHSLDQSRFEQADLYDLEANYANATNNGVGAAATVHPLATEAALNAFEQGGNAIDAAVAAALTLGVVDNHNSGIGGGNFAVIHFSDGRIEALDGREMAPKAASRDMYIRDGAVNTALSKTGALAIGVPGSLAVYDYMLEQGGKLSLADLILPAAKLAERGFPLSQVSHDRLQSNAEKIRQFPDAAKILLDYKSNAWPAGHWLIQKDLAKTYRQLAAEGIDYFYRGDFARRLEQWMQRHGGIVTSEDFANYRMLVREPVKTQYRNFTIVGFPPPSSGGVHVAQILNILEHFDIASLPESDRYHLLAEAMKLAFADRAHYLGDPDFVPVPKALVSRAYAETLAKKISFDGAAENVFHGKPPGADIDLFGKHTTHISTVDKHGNWVAITTTVNTSFGSKVIIPETGVLMNNQMDDFSIRPGVPNAFGLVGNEANSVQPLKRPLSSMSPTLVLRDDKPIITIGAAGGPTIITQVLQGIVNLVDLGMSLNEALATSRIHHQWRPEVTFIENSLPDFVQENLQQRGHKLHVRGFAGVTQAISVDSEGEFEAVTEPRIIKRNKM